MKSNVELHEGLLIDTREIFLHSSFESFEEEDQGIDFRVANTFLKNLKYLEAISSKPITIYQYSIGGNWFDGMMVFDAIKSSKCHITVVMCGQACSMGSLIPQAADTRIIMPNTLFMTHEGTIQINDLTIKQADSFSVIDKYCRQQMLEIYASRCVEGEYFRNKGYTKDQVKKFIYNKWNKFSDWYLLPIDVVKYGFSDKIGGEE